MTYEIETRNVWLKALKETTQKIFRSRVTQVTYIDVLLLVFIRRRPLTPLHFKLLFENYKGQLLPFLICNLSIAMTLLFPGPHGRANIKKGKIF